MTVYRRRVLLYYIQLAGHFLIHATKGRILRDILYTVHRAPDVCKREFIMTIQISILTFCVQQPINSIMLCMTCYNILFILILFGILANLSEL